MSQMPDKIWVHKDTKHSTADTVCGYQYKFLTEEEGADNFVEYARTDAFIKKASEWIETNVEYYMKADKSCSMPMCPQFSKIDFIEKFKNAMKL